MLEANTVELLCELAIITADENDICYEDAIDCAIINAEVNDFITLQEVIDFIAAREDRYAFTATNFVGSKLERELSLKLKRGEQKPLVYSEHEI